MKYHIVTFGCAANTSDSERIASYYAARGFTQAKLIKDADEIIINTCMIRQMAEDRVYGLVKTIQ
jgi:tRNA-2-methylthio-N6-dimethylallyladenosine synthase